MDEDDQRLVISDYQPRWTAQFQEVAMDLRSALGDGVLRIDHIGSTSVPGLAAKDLIDVQLTVRDLADVDTWPDELLPGLIRRSGFADHVPAGGHPDPLEWTKRYWSRPHNLHVHVREHGRLNQRYALLFRDYLRSEPRAAAAYADLKRALAAAIPNDRDTYSVVKDPACDLIMLAAEQWAALNEWAPAASDARPALRNKLAATTRTRQNARAERPPPSRPRRAPIGTSALLARRTRDDCRRVER